MGYYRFNKQKLEGKDPLSELKEHVDGFIFLAYTKEGHKKIALKHATDQACADGLSFLDQRVGEWLELGKDTKGLKIDEGKDGQKE